LLETEFRNAVRRNVDGSIAIINKQLSSICSDENQLLLKAIEIDSSHFNADFDLSKFDEEIVAKQAERKEALEGQYRAEDDQFDAERISSQIKYIEKSMDVANDQYRTSMSPHDPGVKMRTERREREIRTKERSWWNPKRWFGNKWHTSIEQYDEKIADYTEHNFYIKQKAELKKEYQDRMLDLETKRQELEDKKSGLLKGSRDARKFQIDREELEEQIAKLREERDEKLDSVIKKQLKKARAYVESIFNSLERDSRKQALQALADKETKLCEMAMEILESEIKDELDIKMNKLESLKKKMTLAEQDKDKRLQKIESVRAELKALADKAVALHDAIESIETDKISEQ
jgi:hypothetical protein